MLDLDMQFLFNITDDVTLSMKIDDLKITVVTAYESEVKVNLITTRFKIGIVTSLVTNAINGKLENGVEIGAWLVSHGLGILNLEEMTLTEGDGYVYIEVTPQYRRQSLPSFNIWAPDFQMLADHAMAVDFSQMKKELLAEAKAEHAVKMTEF